MIQSADSYQISDILSIDKDVQYIVPKYQREYAWKKQNWEDLLNDLLENGEGHFLGSIICVNKNTDSLRTNKLEVIDGQQRLTTISLLYLAIYNKIKKLLDDGKKEDEDLKNELLNLKWRILQKANRTETKLVLEEQHKNYQDYKSLLTNSQLLEFEEKNTNLGNRRIAKTYNYFSNKLEEEKLTEKTNILSFLKKVNSALLVKIEVKTTTDAFTLFESLNNRGMPLSALDLIKNKLFSELERHKIMTINEAFKKWQLILENLPDEKDQERFLRHYYNAFKHKEEINIRGIPKATKSNLITIYEKLIEKNPNQIFKELQDKSKIYHKFLAPENQEIASTLLTDLININASPAYQLLLYIFSQTEDEKLHEKTLQLLINYGVRRNLTDVPSTRDLDSIYMTLINQLEDNLSYETIRKHMTESKNHATIEEFKKKLSGSIYEDNVGVTRFILSKIEETKSNTREIYTDFWNRDEKNNFIWTIEHIFPQGDNIPEEWIKMIANGDIEKAKELQEEHVHKIGNLTLTGYNPNLSNQEFLKKRDKKDASGKYIGFKNGLYLNEDLKNKDEWKIEDIKKRSEKLINESIKIFKFDNE